ncbi:hypothetical protein MCOR27_000787 [Pyricularia oryzae]|uniref:Uncharacterized protein n=2 Tax=Pyricularia TaxID=48558 RepID=A0ABQ8NIH2_PYRGI|nr:hypothetical protein MCOR01_001843 [Pyricularia oryzae]KAI6297584.1 hypothetical protein MCOR33_006094 [Pyricularia grisea]KAH9429585.1 hypothetical protein MCOR02_009321 [Pyricularia oryzae]KAI6259742.1 hypothetical protein MCOR19_003881 [Pyricularia oryzae]KAI6277963.1 hypothetical protein MCOR26_004835 [Pyricularia oryzae]
MSSTDQQAGPTKAHGHAHLQPIFTPRRTLSVIVIGAGASGLLTAYKLQRNFDDFSLQVFEKNPEISGTWYENRYPGCACDVPSHNYTWSFEPKTDWSANYASSKEILKYFKDFSTKYGLQKYIQLRHQVVGAQWDQNKALWTVSVKNLQTGDTFQSQARVLINAGGILNAWRYPAIPGIESFQGQLIHSAAWPEQEPDMTGKTVGLIGNGSSGIQILPAIKTKVGKVTNFVRQPTWISQTFSGDFREYTDEERKKFAEDKEHHLAMRKEDERKMSAAFAMFHSGSQEQITLRAYVEDLMRKKLGNPELEKLIIPEWSLGCRRLTPGTNYLESLSDDNVEVVFGNIAKITPAGVVVENGKEYPLDILICATGFDTSFKPRFPVEGAGGAKLEDMWKDEPQAYFGIAVDKLPNYFMTLGPNCPIGNGPILASIEAEVDYMIKMMSKMQKENLKSFEVNSDAVRDFNQWKDEWMKESVWVEPCRSWYTAGSPSGKVLALWPGSALHYLEAIRDPRWEDWTFKTADGANRFSYLGNGHSFVEANQGDLSYYIRDHDDSPIDPVLKKPTKE